MDGILAIFIIFGVLVLVLPIIAIIKASGASNQVELLRSEVAFLKAQLQGRVKPSETAAAPPKEAPKAKVAASIAPDPVKTAQPWAPPEQKTKPVKKPAEAAKAVPPTPKGPSFIERLLANFKVNWITWLAAISLAFGGLFIVQYGIERGFLGPVARVISALSFGLALMGVAEYLRRKPNMGMQGWFTVPVALAAGGIASLYGGVVSAHVMYDLTSPLVGFISMVGVSFLAVGAGLIYGPVLAVVGILGAYVSPMLVTGGEGSPILYLYFLVVLSGALVVERHQRWIWLSALAVAFSLFWGFILNESIEGQPYLALYNMAVILLVATLPAFGLWMKWGRSEMLDRQSLGNISLHYPTVLTVLTALGGVGMLSMVSGDTLILWQVTLLVYPAMMVWGIFWCHRAENLDQLPMIFGMGLLLSAIVANPQNTYGFSDDPKTIFSLASTVCAITAGLFLLAAFWRTGRSTRPLYWVALGAIAPVLTYFLLYANWHSFTPLGERSWVFIAVLLALFLGLSALLMLRSRIRQRRTASDLFFMGALVTTSFAAYLIVEPVYLAHSAILLALTALALVIRFKYRWTGYLIWAFVAGASSLIIFDLFPGYSLREPVLMVVAVFGVAIGLFVAGYLMARKAELPERAVLFETATLLTIALLICSLIARVASGGHWQAGYLPIGLYATVWMLMAGVQFRRMAAIPDRLTQVRRYLGYGYGILGLAALVISMGLSPLFTGVISGFFPIDTVMAAFALPVMAAGGLYYVGLLPQFITRKFALGFGRGMAMFIAIQQVRRFWHGANIQLERGTQVGELYTYTVVLLSATLVSVVLAISRKDAGLRKLGLGLAALTAAKVFLWDTAGMQGLARATVFIALGLTLAGIGWLLQTQTEAEGVSVPKD